MEKAPKTRRVTRGVVILAVVIVCAAAVGVVFATRHSTASSTTVRSPNAVVVTTTVPYSARPGPNGTRILTEPVDPLTLAVPTSWKAPPPDPLTLQGEIDSFARDAPALAALLQAEGNVAGKSAIRLFAYQAVAPHAFVSVISFSSPGVKDLTPEAVDAMAAAARLKTKNVAVSGARLPVGQVLKLDSSFVSHKQTVVVEAVILIKGGRSMLIEMVSETDTAGIPAVFDQIAQSMRLG